MNPNRREFLKSLIAGAVDAKLPAPALTPAPTLKPNGKVLWVSVPSPIPVDRVIRGGSRAGKSLRMRNAIKQLPSGTIILMD